MTVYKCRVCDKVDGSVYNMTTDRYLCPICGLELSVIDEFYRLPKYRSVNQKPLLWHVAKLAEEAGEVCQAVCKDLDEDAIVEECIDVIQCAENVLRHLYVSDDHLGKLLEEHVAKDLERDYLEVVCDERREG